MNPFKWLRNWIDSQTPTGDRSTPKGKPDWRGFMGEMLRLDTWIDSAAIKELFFGEYNRIDFDPRIDQEEGPFVTTNPGGNHEGTH